MLSHKGNALVDTQTIADLLQDPRSGSDDLLVRAVLMLMIIRASQKIVIRMKPLGKVTSRWWFQQGWGREKMVQNECDYTNVCAGALPI